jgi:hypothetical protein
VRSRKAAAFIFLSLFTSLFGIPSPSEAPLTTTTRSYFGPVAELVGREGGLTNAALLDQLYGSGARRMNLELESSKARLFIMIGLAGSKARAFRNFALALARSPRNI